MKKPEIWYPVERQRCNSVHEYSLADDKPGKSRMVKTRCMKEKGHDGKHYNAESGKIW